MDKQEIIDAVTSRRDCLALAQVARFVDSVFAAAVGGEITFGRTVKLTDFGRSGQ